MLKEYSIEGRVAIVTGAGRGIGKGIALTLAEAGADIVAVDRTTEENEQTASEVQALGATMPGYNHRCHQRRPGTADG